MKYLQVFETQAEYESYYPSGLTSEVLVYVKETENVYFATNNIDGEFKEYISVISGGDEMVKVQTLTQEEYDDLDEPDEKTLYLIEEEEELP